MYKALVVDDEPVIREGLRFLVDWAAHGFEVAATACDGEEALAWMRAHHADLLVTDVRMPKLSGIELMRCLRQENPELRVIVISGYNEFEYVRAMTPLGIENYLLKPINEDEFAGTLQNIADKLDRAHAKNERVAQDEGLIHQNIINRWLYGAIGEHELQDRAAFLGLDLEATPFRPVILRFSKDVGQVAAEVQNGSFRDCRAILQQWPMCYCAQNYDGETLMVVGNWQRDEEVLPLLARCVENAQRAYGLALLVSVGSPVQGYWQLADSFRQARRRAVALDLKQYLDVEPLNDMLDEKSPLSIRLAQYVLEHYSEELSLKQLANHFRGNAAYIGQLFRHDMGKSFGDYLKAVRLEKARQMLRGTDLSAVEIAQKVGFANANYFFTLFRKETGLSPNEYRTTHSE